MIPLSSRASRPQDMNSTTVRLHWSIRFTLFYQRESLTCVILFGTNLYSATGEAARRQHRAATALRDVAPLPPVNLQFADDPNPCELEGLITRPCLLMDSQRITRRKGPRKPIVTEVLTRLAEAAMECGARYFGYLNSDIIVTGEAVTRIEPADYEAYIFSRTDFTPGSERDLQPMIYGTDVFVIDASWWLTHRHQFRPYIIGEGCWDNVFTSQLLCWTRGVLLNRDPLVRHEWHEAMWHNSPYARHNGYLAGLDRMYFTQWARYIYHLEQ